MKILFVSSDQIPHIGGKSTHILDLMDGLNNLGNETYLLSLNDVHKLKILLLKMMLLPFRLINKKYYRYLYIIFYRIIFSRCIIQFVNKHHVDVICAQDPIAACACKEVNKRYNVPIHLTMHTYFGIENTLDNTNINIESKVLKKIVDFELGCIDIVRAITTVDQRILRHVQQQIGNKKIILSSISNFTNTERFKPVSNEQKKIIRDKYNYSENDFIILCSRRLVEKNGVKYLLKAINHMQCKENILVLIIGDGIQKQNLVEYTYNNNINHIIKFLGNVDNKDIHEYYQLSDISVVPSITVNGLQEATSISAIESMACGVPVLASNIGGLTELIENNFTGILFTEKDYKTIANSIEKLKINKEYYRLLSNNSINYISVNHSHLSAANRFKDIFEQIKTIK
ncbi:glycosyltransferase family 4 protein [Turicibacter bilis]|uniref:Glycosyltransferase family 4 protein n=1 Tax=Turicibacter bilis TaxID=2735723 RepID=A0A9Q9CGW6_9FIRM|nr:glycosyltransferase family 4 protein [Turicibacter bilis]MBS3198666.1 glycosyltransferase family 4 protein [Turicibacter bilis]UUF08315.1 glycosyltransferase family 4 protein [Turicibacter bilis]